MAPKQLRLKTMEKAKNIFLFSGWPCTHCTGKVHTGKEHPQQDEDLQVSIMSLL